MSPRRPRAVLDTQLLVRAFQRAIAAIVVPGRYHVDLVSTDPKDNPVLACAIEGMADYVVTDDRRDLLPPKVVRLSGHAPIQIVSAGGFLRLLHD
jgi:predicted nucleic acid-binding protein